VLSIELASADGQLRRDLLRVQSFYVALIQNAIPPPLRGSDRDVCLGFQFLDGLEEYLSQHFSSDAIASGVGDQKIGQGVSLQIHVVVEVGKGILYLVGEL